MGRYWCVCVLLLCVAVLVPCLAGAEDGGAAVRHISGLPQFYELLQEKPFVAVAFVANYCPHSKVCSGLVRKKEEGLELQEGLTAARRRLVAA